MFPRLINLNFLGFFIFFINIFTANAVINSSPKKICPKDEHWVRAHSQSSYVRGDGTFVFGSFPSDQC